MHTDSLRKDVEREPCGTYLDPDPIGRREPLLLFDQSTRGLPIQLVTECQTAGQSAESAESLCHRQTVGSP